MANETTTLKLNRKTKERLDILRQYKRETYDEILQKLLNILNICKINPIAAQSKLRSIDKLHKKTNILKKSIQ
jgi:hypothetical protein